MKFVVAIVLTWPLLCNAQWTNFTPANTQGPGLRTITDIAPSNTGTWFGSDAGLWYRNSNTGAWSSASLGALTNNWVYDVDLMNDNKVAIATDNGMAIIDLVGSNQFWTGDNIPVKFLRGVESLNATTFWVATMGYGVAKRTNSGWQVFNTADGLPTNFFRCVVQDQIGNMWFGSQGHGVLRFNGSSWEQFTTADGLVSNTVLKMTVANDGAVWMAGPGGLTRFHDATFTPMNQSWGTVSVNYTSVAAASDGNVLAAGEQGIDVFTGADLVNHIGTAQGLYSNDVATVAQEPNGRIWAGYNGQGCSVKIDGSWRHFTPEHGLAGGTTYYNIKGELATRAPNGNMFFIYGQSIFEYDYINWKKHTPGGDLRSYYDLKNDLNGDVLVRSDGGFFRFSSGAWSFTPDDTFGNIGSFGPMAVDPSGSYWFIVSEGLHRKTQSGVLSQFYASELIGNNYLRRNLALGSDGKIWHISDSHLSQFSNNQWFHMPLPFVNTYYERTNHFSLCTNGVGQPYFIRERDYHYYPYNQDSLEIWKYKQPFFTKVLSLPNAGVGYINDMMFDQNGQLWICGSELSMPNVYDRASCLVIAENGDLLRINRSKDGVIGEFIQDVFQEPDGTMWLTGSQGISMGNALTVGIEDQNMTTESKEVVVYPNPSFGDVSLSFTPTENTVVITVFDLMGRVLFRKDHFAIPNFENIIAINLSHLPNGPYMLRAGEFSTPIIINH